MCQQECLESLLPPVEEEESVGEAIVLKTFALTGSKKANVAGCRVKSGRLERKCVFRVLRDGEVVYEGEGKRTLRVRGDCVRVRGDCVIIQ